MSLYKRNGIWWVYLTAPEGKRLRRSTHTPDKAQAQQTHDLLKADLIRRPDTLLKGNQTWEDAGKRWLRESQHKASLVHDEKVVELFTKHIGQKKLRSITNDVIQGVINTREAELKPASINRYLDTVRAILRKAEKEWDWLDRAPTIRMRHVANKRVRYLTKDEAEKLLSNLPKHQRDMAEFALLTGLRQRNVLELAWSQIDLERSVCWIHPDQSKTRKAIPVPLNSRAVALLTSLYRSGAGRVFTYKGEAIGQVNTKAWHAALKRADIENFRWHDLRHTWATWHIQNGTPPHVLQELGGWSSYEMVRRYAHLSAEHLANYCGNVM